MNDEITILAVDDDSMHTEMICTILSEYGCRVLQCFNGFEAIQVLEHNPDIDVILVDLEMPVMNGRELIQYVKQADKLQHLPMVVLTSSVHEVTPSLSLGASDFLAKPINREEMRLRVMHQVRIKKLADQDKKKLQQSEVRLEQLLQSTTHGIYSLDMEGTCTFINRPGMQLLGFQSEDVIGKKINSLLKCKPLDDLTEHCLSQKSMHREASFSCDDLSICNKECHFFPSSFSSSPLLDNGMIVGAVVTFSDITEQKRLEEARTNLAAIVESSDDAILAETLDGIITSWNGGAERIYGYSHEEVVGSHISIITPESHRSEESDFLQRIRNGDRIKHYDTVRRHKDGHSIDVSVSLSPIYDRSGKIVGVSAITHDITERITMEAALSESEERFRSLANSAPVLIWLAGLDKLCYWFNDVWLNFTGRTLEQEQGNGWAEGVHPDDLDRCLETYVTCFDNRQSFSMEYRLLRSDGSYRWILDNGMPTFAKGIFTGYVGSCIDITEQKQLSVSLEASEHFMRKLIDVLPGMVGYWDQDLRCGFANRAYQEWFGKSPEEMKGIHIRDLMGNELFEKNAPFITSAMRGEPQHFERTLTKSDGSTGYTWANYIPDSDDDGVHGFFVMVTDVTDLKKAEANLSAQDQFYRATLDGIRAHICVINPQGTIITTNRAWESFGDQNEAIKEFSSIGANYFFACQSSAAVLDHSVNEFTTGIQSVLDGTSPQFMRGYPCHTPEKDLWFICTANPFSVNGVRYAVISHEDITWRKAAERQLSMLSRVIEQSPVTVVITDTDGTIEFVNPFFVELTGYSAEEAVGQNPRILQSGLTPPETFHELWTTLKRGNIWEGEFINKCKNGNINFEHARVSPIRDEEGVVTHYVSIKENINKRKEMESSLITSKEKAEIANRAKDEFLAVMSHEMRTPLNGVLCLTELLLDSELTQEQHEFAKIANACGHNLLRIISEILDFTLIRVNKLNLENREFNLQIILEEITSKFAPRALEAGLSISSRVAPSVPCHLNGDAGKIQQIVANLVDNALKFTTKGAVVISVTCPTVEHGFAIIRFDIQDTGIGLLESQIKGIFSAFTQADSSTTRTHGGTGLGLALCKELAELLGGEIGVSSEVGKGSTFWFTARLGIARQEHKWESNTGRSDIQSSPNGAGTDQPEATASTPDTRILLAEDSVVNQKIMCILLKNIGYMADVVADGLKAVRALEICDYDLVLMDCMMPEMNGYEATAAIRDLSSNVINHRVPIIAVTANVMHGDREKCLESGMDDYLPKPVKKSDLAVMLEKWLPPEKRQGNQ